MKNANKLLCFILIISTLLLIFTSCTKNAPISPAPPVISNPIKKPVVNLLVWGPADDAVAIETAISSFKKMNIDKEWNITFEAVELSDVQAKYLAAPEAAAHVFIFPSDALDELVKADALSEIIRNKDAIINANVKGAVSAATIDKKLYAYPLSIEGGTVLYYDKSIFDEESVKSVDGLLSKASAARKKVALNFSDQALTGTFFLSAGGKLSSNGKTVVCNFNDPVGEQVGEALKLILSNKSCQAALNGTLAEAFADGLVCAGIADVSDIAKLKSALGGNYSTAPLPSFKLGNKEIPLKSFLSYSFVGVKNGGTFQVESLMLAEWLSGEAFQKLRFASSAAVPTNSIVGASADFAADKAHFSIYRQEENALSDFPLLTPLMAPLKNFTSAVTAKDNAKTVLELLDEAVAAILDSK